MCGLVGVGWHAWSARFYCAALGEREHQANVGLAEVATAGVATRRAHASYRVLKRR
jgi:hypothetical protein